MFVDIPGTLLMEASQYLIFQSDVLVNFLHTDISNENRILLPTLAIHIWLPWKGNIQIILTFLLTLNIKNIYFVHVYKNSM